MISAFHLTKWYGDHLAVDDLSFEIGEGHVYGFLNGAGKSTTMKANLEDIFIELSENREESQG